MDRGAEALQRDERRVHVRRLRVVDVEDAAVGAHLLEAVLDPGERAKALADGVGVDAAGQADGRGGHRVEPVVGAAQADLVVGEQRLVDPPQAPGAVGQLGLGAGPEADAARAAAEVLDAEAERRDGDVVVALVGEHAQLGRAVGLEGAVAVEVVGSDVEQHGALGREGRGVLELERGDLADDDGLGGERVDERAERRADVAGHGHGQARLAVDVADELGRRRLAVRSRDGDELVGHQAPGELDLAEHGDPALAGQGDDRRLGRHAGRLDDRARVLELDDAVASQLAIAAHRLLAAGAQQLHGREAGAREADDQVRAAGERRPHVTVCW